MALGPDARVDAALGATEADYVRCGPVLWAWFLDQWLHVLAILSCVFITWRAEDGAIAWLGVLATFGLSAALMIGALQARYTRYVLTSHRAMRFSGVIRCDQEYMTWSKVTDVSVERSLGDRLTGTGTIKIHSANERSGFRAMRDVGDPMRFAGWVRELVNKKQGSVDLDE